MSKMTMLLNVIYRCNAMPCKIPIIFISKENKFLKYREESKNPLVITAMLEVAQQLLSSFTMQLASKMNATAKKKKEREISRPLK